MKDSELRIDGRKADEMREVTVQLDIAPHATASALVSFGKTRVICAATIKEEVPRWMKVQNVNGGWVTAEYSMLPYSTLDRKERDINKGRPDGRSIEIQRLIGRSMRALVDLEKLGSRTLCIDCDVLQADGGTRTASITGACIVAAIAFERLVASKKIKQNPLKKLVAAISVGLVKQRALLDLCYVEDSAAEVDANVIMTEHGKIVEFQGSGEEATYTEEQMMQLFGLGKKGVKELVEIQRKAIEDARPPANEHDLLKLADYFKK